MPSFWSRDIWGMWNLWQKANESMAQRSRSVDTWNERVHGSYEPNHSVPSIINQENRVKSMANAFGTGPPGPLVLRPDLKPNSDPALQNQAESHPESNKISGTLKVFPGGTPLADNIGFSQVSSPSTTSFSPGRYFTSNVDDY